VRHGKRLGGKSFVGLDQVHVLHRKAGLFKGLPRARHGADAHDRGIHAGSCVRFDLCHGLDAHFVGFLLGHDDYRGRAVVYP
jgi:hypothetical protein